MTDQPVTPDREALETNIRTRIREHVQRVGISGWTTANAAAIAADVCMEAMREARQQGRDEMTEKVVDWLAIGGTDLLARRLARGGPNRKDEE